MPSSVQTHLIVMETYLCALFPLSLYLESLSSKSSSFKVSFKCLCFREAFPNGPSQNESFCLSLDHSVPHHLDVVLSIVNKHLLVFLPMLLPSSVNGGSMPFPSFVPTDFDMVE